MKIERFPQKRAAALLLVFLGLLVLISACSPGAQPAVNPVLEGPQGPPGPAGPQGLVGLTGPAGAPGKAAALPGPGLLVRILGVEFPSDAKPVVSLTITDSQGVTLQPEALEGFGFTIAQIVTDDSSKVSKVQSLLLAEVEGKPFNFAGETRQPVLAGSVQAGSDTQGTWAALDEETYSYTFARTIAPEFDPALTTLVGAFAWKDERTAVANEVYTFIPLSGEAAPPRDVVTTAACQTCHNPIEIHGGTRREVQLCLTCHTDQNIDPETGNTVDLKVLIHRLHAGSGLPSVQEGEPYVIVGYRQNVFDFSKGTWPQDVRNCATCHSGGEQSEAFMTAPSTTACLSCHDNVNVTTGENHPGGKQTDDRCAACHTPTGNEFDASIVGAHTIPGQSSQIKGVNLEILEVSGAEPGKSPTVTFKITDNAGQAIAPADMDNLGLTIAGPTSDYTHRVTETVFRKPASGPADPPKVEDAGGGAFRYTFNAPLPKDTAGSFAVGMEGYVMEKLDGVEAPIRVAGFNPVFYFSLDGGDAAPRRQVVDQQLCSACHQQLALHGGGRQNVEYCVLCHNPTATDEARRPEEAMPPTSINFRVLIHRIHRGKEASQPVEVYGFGGNKYDFSNVLFPGRLSDCQTCHQPGTFGLPLPRGSQATIVKQGDDVVSTTLPVAAVCASCHDSQPVEGHIELATTESDIETCQVCHGAGKEQDVTKVHR